MLESRLFLIWLRKCLEEVHLERGHLEALEYRKKELREVQQNQKQAQALKIKVGPEHQDQVCIKHLNSNLIPFSDHGRKTLLVWEKKHTQKKGKRASTRRKQPIKWYITVKSNTLKPKFYKNWCKYLNIPMNNIWSRDGSIPYDHKQALFIYNLEPSYVSWSHWVATYMRGNKINYFDSFGMPPFKEIVNQAKKRIWHYDIKIIRFKIYTTTCGYFCLYFLRVHHISIYWKCLMYMIQRRMRTIQAICI